MKLGKVKGKRDGKKREGNDKKRKGGKQGKVWLERGKRFPEINLAIVLRLRFNTGMKLNCPYCRRSFAVVCAEVIRLDLPKFGPTYYHVCDKAPWPNKRVRLSGADKQLAALTN